MSSPPEEIETKAGHPAALKVGGMRVANRSRKNSEEVAPAQKPSEEDEDDEFEETVSKSPKPQIVMWGQVRDQQKDYPSQAVQHMQNKPVPTHEANTRPASAKPGIIQQPRK